MLVVQGRRPGGDGFDAAKLAAAAEAPQGHVQTRRSKVADSGAYAAAAAAARRSCFTVAKPVDDDLYGVPPDMLYGKPPGARVRTFCRPFSIEKMHAKFEDIKKPHNTIANIHYIVTTHLKHM